MIKTMATANRFLSAFKALPRPQKNAVVARLARERSIREDLIDLAIADSRRTERSRPLREFLREAHESTA